MLPSSLFYRFPGLKRLLSCSSATALPPCRLLIRPLSAATWGSAPAPGSSSCLPPQTLLREPSALICSTQGPELEKHNTSHRTKPEKQSPDSFLHLRCVFASVLHIPKRKLILQNNTAHSFRPVWLGQNSCALILDHLPTSVKKIQHFG